MKIKINNNYTNEQLYKIHSLKSRKLKGLSLCKNFTHGKGNTVDSGLDHKQSSSSKGNQRNKNVLVKMYLQQSKHRPGA